jgi:hypothetical protein
VLCTAIAVIKSEELTVQWSKGLHIFECIILNFSYFFGLNIYLFQIRTSFVKLISRNQHPLFPLNCHQMFQIKKLLMGSQISYVPLFFISSITFEKSKIFISFLCKVKGSMGSIRKKMNLRK